MSATKYSGHFFPVEAGQLISIAGKVANNPRRFDINLSSSNEYRIDVGDIQLHLSVRFEAPEPVVVRNTHSRGIGWANEERRENLVKPTIFLNPIKQGADFKIDIFVDHLAFFITIDGKPYCTFDHRLPIQAIQKITIEKDVEAVYQVNQVSAQQRPWPVVNPRVFEAFAPKPFSAGSVVVITAMPKGSSSGDFSVNFYDGPNLSRTHFHFRTYLSLRKIVVNSQNEKGFWQTQQDTFPPSYPFSIGQVFKLAIAITNSEFQVAVNGRRITSMTFRDNPQRILSSLTGIAIESRSGLTMEVKSVDFNKLDSVCNGFEHLTDISVYKVIF